MRPRPITAAGLCFVAAWLAGLAIAPAAPDPDTSAHAIAAFYVEHRGATTAQSLLVHGLAGVALLVFACALGAGRRATAAGAAAAITSLVQAATGVALSQVVAVHGSAQAAKTAFDVVNTADTAKLLCLGAFIALASRGMGARMRRAALLLAPLQAIGGLAFVTGSEALYAALYVALPALLVWVAAVAVGARRSPRAAVGVA
jgi:hypothetical protein